MNKKPALILAFLITFLFAVNYVSFTGYSIFQDEKEIAVITRVIDGDTIVIDNNQTIRLVNVNSPEKNFFNSNLALDYLKQFENKTIEIEFLGYDKYKRGLAKIYSGDYLNLELVKRGFAGTFLVENSEKLKFKKAESKAVKEGIGIWNKSEFSGCFESEINPEDEIVILKNYHCGLINLNGWVLKDESRKIYKFGNIEISQSDEIKLYSGKGNDTEKEMFWQSSENIWNNDKDTLYLFDSIGNLVHYDYYGY